MTSARTTCRTGASCSPRRARLRPRRSCSMKAGRNTRRMTDDRKQPIFLLHVMNADGTNMHQISFNTNHDFAPSVLSNGQIVFSRWEVDQRHDQISLYRTNPDGTGLGALLRREQPCDRRQHRRHEQQRHSVPERAAARRRQADRHRAAVPGHAARRRHRADRRREITSRSTSRRTRTALAPAPARAARPRSASPPMRTCRPPGGRFASAYPLYDGTNRMLVSWSPCLVLDTTVTPDTTSVCTSQQHDRRQRARWRRRSTPSGSMTSTPEP